MNKLYMILLLMPLFSLAQKVIPRLEGDTLYTSSGFKMYIGQQIRILHGSGKNGKYQYVHDTWNLDIPSKTPSSRSRNLPALKSLR